MEFSAIFRIDCNLSLNYKTTQHCDSNIINVNVGNLALGYSDNTNNYQTSACNFQQGSRLFENEERKEKDKHKSQ
jgi:hypothetical protein